MNAIIREPRQGNTPNTCTTNTAGKGAITRGNFEAFTKESGKIQGDINHYHIASDKSLTDRAKEVMLNVRDFVMSYNFDDSDPMTDYFHTNFYLTLGIGSYRQPYKIELPKLTGKDCPEVFAHPEGPAHKAVRQALGKARFGFIESRKHIGEMILGEDYYGSQGEHYFWPKEYSSAKTFLGYTPEMETLLEQERQEVAIAHKAWQSKNNIQTNLI